MNYANYITARVGGYFRRNLSIHCAQRVVTLRPPCPVISFTFDDFPQSALETGGEILDRHGVRGTYYVSLGLMNRKIPSGRAFSRAQLKNAVERGHELGCHTFAHCHAWETSAMAFEQSIVENADAIRAIFGAPIFTTLSYPISCPHPTTKRIAAKYFRCCRGGGRVPKRRKGVSANSNNPEFNVGRVDANNLQTYFLEKCGDNLDLARELIDTNRQLNGWLIFATHDISEKPTQFGCRSDHFERIVRYGIESGARVLPVAHAWKFIAGET